MSRVHGVRCDYLRATSSQREAVASLHRSHLLDAWCPHGAAVCRQDDGGRLTMAQKRPRVVGTFAMCSSRPRISMQEVA